MNYFVKILNSYLSLFIIGYEVSLKIFDDKNENIDLQIKIMRK